MMYLSNKGPINNNCIKKIRVLLVISTIMLGMIMCSCDQRDVEESQNTGFTTEELSIMEQVDNACKRYNVQVMGGHTEVTEAVNQPLISVTAVGKVKKGCMVSTGGAKPDMDIVITKWIGLEGTSIIAKDHEEELLTRLPQGLIDTAKGFDQYLSVLPESRVAVEHGVAAMHDITEGGIFGALWEMGEASGVGIDVDLKAIPVKQETIEVCEFFGINPYELISSGSMLIATNDGNGLVRKLADAGVAAAIIGKSNSSNDKRVISGDEVRFLEPPKADALYSVPNVERK